MAVRVRGSNSNKGARVIRTRTIKTVAARVTAGHRPNKGKGGTGGAGG